jgi:hypothetical protein
VFKLISIKRFSYEDFDALDLTNYEIPAGFHHAG